jgi:hypothetical protein
VRNSQSAFKGLADLRDGRSLLLRFLPLLPLSAQQLSRFNDVLSASCSSSFGKLAISLSGQFPSIWTLSMSSLAYLSLLYRPLLRISIFFLIRNQASIRDSLCTHQCKDTSYNCCPTARSRRTSAPCCAYRSSSTSAHYPRISTNGTAT